MHLKQVVLLGAIVTSLLFSKSYTQDFTIGENRLTVDFDTVVTKTRVTIPHDKRVRIATIVNEEFDESFSASVGWTVLNRKGTYATLSGHIDKVYYLSTIPGVVQFTRPSKGQLYMDKARRETYVDDVHHKCMSKLDSNYTGKGVIVGVIDTEFDHTHPAFLDSAGNSRFIAIWDQSRLEGDSTVPAFAFDRAPFGAILNGDELATYPHFTSVESWGYHGTHVLSMAAGSDVDNRYTGVAPEAILLGCRNVVFSQESFTSNIIEAMQWMFHVADSLDMPCVINLSAGDPMDPRDGTALFDRWLEDAVGPGRIFVGAAGNSGDTKEHIQLDLRENVPLHTMISKYDNRHMSTFWGEIGSEFSLRLHLRESSSGEIYSSNIISTSEEFESLDTIELAGGEAILAHLVVTNAHACNDKPNILLTLFQIGETEYDLILEFSGEDVVQGWIGWGQDFEKADPPLEGISTVEGDGDYSMGGVAGISPYAISVGAYTTKRELYDYKNELVNLDVYTGLDESYSTIYDIAPFSSKGPTMDGRIKPDIAAPGNYVVAAATAYVDDWFYPFVIWEDESDKFGRYAAMNGTSCAAPFATGIVALMLQACDTLSPQSVRRILQSTARRDSYTGPDISNVWGGGKIDALAAVKAVIEETGGTPLVTGENAAQLRPAFTIHQRLVRFSGLKENTPMTFSVMNLQGRVVYEKELRQVSSLLLPESLSKAVYIVKLEGGVSEKYSAVQKLILD